jgi:O-methyltransferase involved in polyketide biosynthesis
VRAIPSLPTMARANRAFMERVARQLVRAGIRQFLDIGTGIPTPPNLHEITQRIAPDTRVLYVDNDPIVLSHARALMTSHPSGRTDFVLADFREPDALLAHPALKRTLDLDEPVALMLVGILMYFDDEDDPYGIVATLLDALPSGSHVAITHPTADFAPGAVAEAVEAATRAGITLIPRGRADVERFYSRTDLLEPGVVPLLAWRPEAPVGDPQSAYYYAGVGRKP